MSSEHPVQQVEIRVLGAPPADRIARASGVSAVQVDGTTIRCVVAGSFQPFLESLHGSEVLTLRSTFDPAPTPAPGDPA